MCAAIAISRPSSLVKGTGETIGTVWDEKQESRSWFDTGRYGYLKSDYVVV